MREQLLIGIAGSLIAALLVGVIAWIRSRFGLHLARAHPRASEAFLLFVAVIWFLAAIGSVLLQQWASYSPWMPISVSTIVSLAAFYVLWREMGQFWRVGLWGADRKIADGVDYKKALGLCRNYLDFLGVGASKLTREPEFAAALLRCRPDVPIRLLLLSPSHENLRAAARRAGRDEDEYRDLVLGSLRLIAELKKRRGINIELRFYGDVPIFRLMFIDRSLCLMSYNLFGEGDGSQLPQLHIVKSRETRREVESFYYPLEIYFKRIWDNSEPWDFHSFLEKT